MVTPFQERVYSSLRKVPQGKVTTYKELGHALKSTAYRAIGQALRCNPYAPRVPCHRVVASDGTLGGFKGKRSGEEILEKERMLEQEGVQIKENRIIDFNNLLYTFR